MPNEVLSIVRPASSWWGRSLAFIGRITRGLRPVEMPSDNYAGSDYASNMAFDGYPSARAMSGYRANPWLAAAVNAVAWDSATVPLMVVGRDGQEIEGHPVLALLGEGGHSDPATQSGLLRAQLMADLILDGNAYALPVGLSILRGVAAVYRKHPARIQVVPASDGSPLAYDYLAGQGEPIRYAAEAVLHARDISWHDDPRSLKGSGVVESLDLDIASDVALAQRTRASADNPRPAAFWAPADNEKTWSQPQVHQQRTSLDAAMRDNAGGVAVVSGAGKLETIGWSNEDLQLTEARTWTRETILARTGVTPTRVGLPGANFATAEQENKVYWSNVRTRAKMLEEVFTELATMFPRSEGVRVVHNWQSIEALQPAIMDNLQRIGMHIANGMSPVAAYHREGFDDVTEADFVAPGLGLDEAGGQPAAAAPAPAMTDDLREGLDELRAAREDLASLMGATEMDEAERMEVLIGVLGSIEAAEAAIRRHGVQAEAAAA